MFSIYFQLNILKLLFFVHIITNTESADAPFEACTTPNNTNGQCINIRECPSLLNLLRADPNSKENVQYLRKANCGYEKVDPKVCCSLLTRSEEPIPWVPINEKELKELPTAYLLPSLDMCGPRQIYKISEGDATELGEYPWMALLEYQTPNGRSFHCGGSLISSRYILTAAHCVDQQALPINWTLVGVRLGEHNTSTNPDCVAFNEQQHCAPPAIDLEISEQIVHHSYSARDTNRYDDIALLRLDSEVSFTYYVKPICLPTTQSLLEQNYAGENTTVAGWGGTKEHVSSDIKLKTVLTVTTTTKCASLYTSQGVALGRSQICAEGVGGRDSCRGDSGGPLMSLNIADDDFSWYAIGLVSFGPATCGQQGLPGVYTKVSDYMVWIINNLKP